MTPEQLLRLAVLMDFHFNAKRNGFRGLHVDYARFIAKGQIEEVMASREKHCVALRGLASA